jgi:hypothetical protein
VLLLLSLPVLADNLEWDPRSVIILPNSGEVRCYRY